MNLIAILIAILAAASSARGELPSIRLDRIVPLGAEAGTTVEVVFFGQDTEDVTAVLTDHPGISATELSAMPAENGRTGRFRLTVAADVHEGTYDLRLVGRFGVSNPRLFAVAHGLTDVPEKEPNNIASEAQAVALNSAVHGQSDGNNEDTYRLRLESGRRVTIACEAQKLDSEMDALLVLADAAGKILATSSDYFGRDPAIDFQAAVEGEYLITVHDLSYRGGYPYRLLVSTRPQIENVFPAAVERGKPAQLTALGRNFGPSGGASPWKIDGLPLEELRFDFVAPTDQAAGEYTFFEHPTDHAVLPTAATSTLDGLQVRPPLAEDAMRPATLVLSDAPVIVEAEPNDDDSHPQKIVVPSTLGGRFDQPRDADWYEFEAAEDGAYAVEVYCERIAGRADPYVVITDDKGARLTELDDIGIRLNAFDGYQRDPVGMVNLSAKKTYRLLVQDRYQRGGARYHYVLAVRRPRPDFHVAAIHSENPGPAATTVWRGGAAHINLVIARSDGHSLPVTITADGLPPGLHASPTTIDSDVQGPLVLWADRDAPEWTGTIRLFASTRQEVQEIVRRVRPFTRVWNIANVSSSRPMRELAVAVRGESPYGLAIEPAAVRVVAGEKAELKLVLERNWPDFQDKVRAIPLAFPGNFQMNEVEIGAGQSEVPLTITVQAGTRPGDHSLVVLGQAQAPYAKDPAAGQRPVTLVSIPSRSVTITVLEPGKK